MNIGRKILTLYFFSIALIIVFFIPTVTYFENREANALDEIEERQVKDGTQYTATVESYDVSNQLLIMDNGHEIDATELSRQPDVGAELSYIKTSDYELSKWNSTPKETGETAFINVKIMN